jgi:NADP-dependent aldehyde dehydrogenase
MTGPNRCGQWIAGRASREGALTFTGFDPRTSEPLAPVFADATSAEIDRAVRAAQESSLQTRHLPAARLAALLEAVALEIESLGEVLFETADRETGLGIPRLAGERERTTGQLRMFADVLREGSYAEAVIDRARPDRKPSPRPDIRRMLFPLGPVAVFPAGNFPFAFGPAGGDTASALAAGCPVVVKGHPGYPSTSDLFAGAVNKAIEAQGFPPGLFSLLQGDRPEVGRALVEHPGISAVGFTGSLAAGRSIFDAAAARPDPIPVYAEMGSVNPIVLLPGALAERGKGIAEELAASVTLGGGQFCTNPGLVFVVDGPAAEGFVSGLSARLRERPACVLLSSRIERGLSRAVSATVSRPAVERLTGTDAKALSGCLYPPTVMRTTSTAFRGDPGLQSEHFGPVTLIVVCDSLDDLLFTLPSLHGTLTATVHASDLEKDTARAVLSLLRDKAGRLIWNGYPTGVEVVAAMQHGGPYPATTAPWSTSVGTPAVKRFLRPVAFQNFPQELLPEALQDANPLGIIRLVDGRSTRDAIPQKGLGVSSPSAR